MTKFHCNVLAMLVLQMKIRSDKFNDELPVRSLLINITHLCRNSPVRSLIGPNSVNISLT